MAAGPVSTLWDTHSNRQLETEALVENNVCSPSPKNYVKTILLWEVSGLKTSFFFLKTLKSRDVCYCLQIIWKFAQFCKQPTVFAEKTCALAYALWLSFVPLLLLWDSASWSTELLGRKLSQLGFENWSFPDGLLVPHSWKIGYFWRYFVTSTTTYSSARRPDTKINLQTGFWALLKCFEFYFFCHQHQDHDDQIKR